MMIMRMKLSFAFILLALSVLTCFANETAVPIQKDASGEQMYQTLCASCHGAQLQGGQAQSLVDAIWQFGSGRGDIRRNIKHGIADFAMPAFEATLSDQQIGRIMDFLSEAEKTSGVTKPPPPVKLFTLDYEVNVEIWLKDLNIPWSIDFADRHTALVTERPGRLRVVVDGELQAEPVQGTPQVLHEGQGGLLDVVLDPDYASNGWVYLSYSHPLELPDQERILTMTRIVRGRIRDNTWVDQEVVYEAAPEHYSRTRHHYGSRIVFDRTGHLFFSVGERGDAPFAQKLDRPNGKIHRVFPDGTIPPDNPFVGQAGALPSIYSYGHRNPQGLAIHPETGQLWETEHGPMGGDELNLILPGRNYGWPEVTYGRDYSGMKISDFREKPGMESPILYWSPSIAACGSDFVRGDLFPRWRDKLLAGALKYEEVRLLDIQDGRVLHQEIILKNAGRVRDVCSGPDGAIYVVLNGPDVILRLTPLRDVNEGPQ
jgi:glucose/arabinose dehydrogenase